MIVRWPRLLNPSRLRRIIQSQKNPEMALHIFRDAKLRYPNYRHNGLVYATMISILGNSGRIGKMKEVINEMKEDSCECKDFVFEYAINIFEGQGMLDEAVTLFRNIPSFNCVNWTETFNSLLRIMIKEDRLETAYHIFLESSYGWEVKSRLDSLNLLMESLCQMRRSDLALHVFQELNYQGCYPNRDSYHILMKGLCDDERFNEAIHLLYSMFWRISQKGSGEDIVVYRTLLNALCDKGQVQEAVEILGKILKKGLKAKRCRLDIDPTRFSIGEEEVVKSLINECLIRGGIPSTASFTAMAVDLYNESRIMEAEKVLTEMRSAGFRPSPSIYEAKLTALCRAGEVDRAVTVIDEEMIGENCLPTRQAYNIVLKGLCDQGNSALAVSYFWKMVKAPRCVPDRETFEIILDGLIREDQFIEASRIMEQMLFKSHQPSADYFNVLIKGLCAVDRQYDAVMWLEEMISRGNLPDFHLWNSLASSVCCKKSNIDNLLASEIV